MLSTPLHQLKRRARLLSRSNNIKLSEALDTVAQTEGYRAWSHLSASQPRSTIDKLRNSLCPGDIVLIGARPGQGKTKLALDLLTAVIANKGKAAFFTSEFGRDALVEMKLDPRIHVDLTGRIDAAYVTDRCHSYTSGSVVAIDYLQLMDQNRDTPPLRVQIEQISKHAKRTGVVFILVSQIDRNFDPSVKPLPDMDDLRLPNPFDRNLVTKSCFLHAGRVTISP